MKRVFSLRNRVLVTSILMGLLFSASSFTIGPVQDSPTNDNIPQKKSQRVKIIVSKDGKVTEIDTTLNLADEKKIQFKVDSMLKRYDITIQKCDSGMGSQGKRIIRIGKDGNFNTFGWHDGDMMIPPPPPVPHKSNFTFYKQFGADPYAFDTKDESVISYEKKDIGNGLERITIVRKKKSEQKENKEVRVTVETSDDKTK
jgi:hypothetical protein